MSDTNKNRKYDRQRKSPQNIAYKATNRRERNKAHKLLRHLDALPNDKQAAAALRALSKVSVNAIRDAARRRGMHPDSVNRYIV